LQDPIATTEESDSDLPEAFAVNDKGLPRKVFVLRQGLYRKAKREPEFRFYSLYGLILRPDVLRSAWERVASNDGAPGVDGVSIQAVRSSPTGVDGFLAEIFEALKSRTYRPQPVRRVYIEKDNGKLRPLGIPTVRDRVVQMAVTLLLEPIFEADFLDCSMGFRPRRSAHQALEAVRENLRQGRTAVYDADLASYFDTIPHENLIKCVEKRVADRSVLTLIRMWLKAIVVEDDDAGTKGGGRKVSRPKQGTPQGGVISPLLANLYLHWFDKMFHRSDGPFRWANARMVRYADDFVILAKFVSWRIEGFVSSVLEGRMKLTINRSKTRTVKLSDPGESLDFLGYTFRYDRDLYGGEKRYLNVFPSRKSLLKERNKLREMTGPSRCFLPVVTLIGQVNMNLRGWGAYFSRGYPAKAFRQINSYAVQRLTGHLQRRSQRPFHPPKGVSWYEQLHRLGLVPLRGSVSRQ
jgi:RNA-directed DNA polymerase